MPKKIRWVWIRQWRELEPRWDNAHGNTLALSLLVVSMSPLCISVLSNSRAKVETRSSRSRCFSRCKKDGREGGTSIGPTRARPRIRVSCWWWYKSEFDSAHWASGANETGAARYVRLVANDNKSRWRVLASKRSQIRRYIVGGNTDCESERLGANVKRDKLEGPTYYFGAPNTRS